MATIIDSKLNIQHTRGDTARIRVACTNQATGEAYDIQAGDTLTLTVKQSTRDKEPVLQKTVKGTSLIVLDPEDTASLAYGRYRYDVQLTCADGSVQTVTGTRPPTFTICEECTW